LATLIATRREVTSDADPISAGASYFELDPQAALAANTERGRLR